MTPKLPQARHARRVALGAELRRLRERSGTSGRSLADRLGINQERLSRIEVGLTPANVPMVSAWAQAVGANDDDIARLQWLTDRALEEFIPLAPLIAEKGLVGIQKEIAEAEKVARLITNFQPGFVPGLLQTAAYARSLISTFAKPEDVDAIVAARVERQQILTDPARSFEFILTDSALRWRAGDAGVLPAQMDRIASVAGMDHVIVRVIARDAVWRTAPTCAFVLYQERDDEEKALATAETPTGRIIGADTAAYQRELELLRRSALSESESSAYIRGFDV